MTIAEQLKQEGLQQGLLEGIELAIHLLFGASGAHLLSDISHIQDVSAFRRIKEAMMTANPEKLEKAVQTALEKTDRKPSRPELLDGNTAARVAGSIRKAIGGTL